MIEEIKILLGDSLDNYTESQIELCLKHSLAEVQAYCGRELDYELEIIATRIAIIKLNRLNSEGLSSQSFSGVSESFINGYPDDIKSVLAIFINTQGIDESIKYSKCTYMGLTREEIDDKYVIYFKGIKLKVLYVNPSGRYKQVFMGEM